MAAQDLWMYSVKAMALLCYLVHSITDHSAIATTIQADNATVTLPQNTAEPVVEAFLRLRYLLTADRSPETIIPPSYYPDFKHVFLSYEPLQIVLFDEVLQSISIAAAFWITWHDPTIGWNPDSFQGISTLKVPSSLVWTPTIEVPGIATVNQWKFPEYINVFANGQVSAFIPAITTTLCKLDLHDFPFDEQNCTLTFVDRGLHNITTWWTSSGDIRQYFGTNAAWILLSYNCTELEMTYTREDNNQVTHAQYISCYVWIQRRSDFYIFNFIGPMAVTSVMTLMVFFIPVEGREKISFIVTIFLSSSMYYEFIINMMPRSLETLPRMNWLVVAIVVNIILATAATTFVLIRHRKVQRRQHRRKHRDVQILHGKVKYRNEFNKQKFASDRESTDVTADDTRRSKFKDESYKDRDVGVKSVTGCRDAGHPGVITSDCEAGRPEADQKWTQKLLLTHRDLDKTFFCVMCCGTVVVYACVFLLDFT